MMMRPWAKDLLIDVAKAALFAVLLTIFFALVYMFVWVRCHEVHINYTDSLPFGLYQETHELIDRGTLVVECLPVVLAQLAQERDWIGKGYCPTGTPPILKQVVGLPGDTIELTDEYVAVNGLQIPHSATLFVDSQGRPVPAVERGTFTLKIGEVFLLATNIPNSWDSRYTGPVALENIIGTARPVWTEKAHEYK